MTDTAGASVRVRYSTACKGTLVQENRKCDHLEIGDVVNFNVSIEVALEYVNYLMCLDLIVLILIFFVYRR
jgi:hypothetical protein